MCTYFLKSELEFYFRISSHLASTHSLSRTYVMQGKWTFRASNRPFFRIILKFPPKVDSKPFVHVDSFNFLIFQNFIIRAFWIVMYIIISGK